MSRWQGLARGWERFLNRVPWRPGVGTVVLDHGGIGAYGGQRGWSRALHEANSTILPVAEVEVNVF